MSAVVVSKSVLEHAERQGSSEDSAYGIGATRRPSRSNREWLHNLRATDTPEQEAAIADLYAYLYRAVLYFFSRSDGARHGLARIEIERLADDLAQDALLAILKHLDEFRGDSKFTTWAYRFAINLSLVETRRREWKNISLETLQERAGQPEWEFKDEGAPYPERVAQQQEIWKILRDVIEHDLTRRQRALLLAIVFDDVPVDVITERCGTNRNAVYKMMHDARRKIKNQLEKRGLAVSEILELATT
jgi:RNA polymerase sigma-70 factor (ECF subfamily)